MFLSCSAKKGTKEGVIGEALRKCALPYVPRPPLRQPAFKNVPIFERLQLKYYEFFQCRLPKIGTFSVVGWRCGRGFQRGRICVAPLWLTSFGPFLVQQQEKDITAPSMTKKVYLSVNKKQPPGSSRRAALGWDGNGLFGNPRIFPRHQPAIWWSKKKEKRENKNAC